MTPRWLAATAILLVVGAAHLPSFRGEFLFDDRETFHRNPELDSIGFGAPDQSPVAGRPVVAFSLSLDTAFRGRAARGYHLVNWLAHLANALLVGHLVHVALRAAPGHPRAGELALGCALLWGVHPLQTEAVTYLTQRTELFVTLFTLGALACTVERARSGSARWTAGAAACALLACGSKESAAVIPPVAICFDRAFLAPSWRELIRARGRHHLALVVLTWSAIAIILAQGYRSKSVGAALGISPWEYLKTQAGAIAHYARLAIWPDALTLDYGIPHPTPLAEALLPGLAVLAAAAGALLLFLRRPALGFWALLPFIALAPTSTVVPIVTEVAAERRMYLALLGPVVLFALLLDLACRRGAGDSRGALVRRGATLLLVALLAVATLARERLYADPIAIWLDATAKRPENARAHTNLAVELLARGRIDEAERSLERSLALDPSHDDSLFYLSAILMKKALYPRALERLARIGGDSPHRAIALIWTGIAAERSDRYAEAISAYREALAIDPEQPSARNNLAWILATCPEAEHRDPGAALALIAPVYRPAEGSGELRDTAAACLAANGRFEEALAEATRLLDLAQEIARSGRTAESISNESMLAARRDQYARGEPWVDRADSGAARFQGALRWVSFDFSW
jgi:tetratricopeptide (TPR) repeat protein